MLDCVTIPFRYPPHAFSVKYSKPNIELNEHFAATILFGPQVKVQVTAVSIKHQIHAYYELISFGSLNMVTALKCIISVTKWRLTFLLPFSY